MINCELNSSLKLKSNIIEKSKCISYSDKIKYIPFDLMGKEYNDVRLYSFLSKKQQEEHDKMLFMALEIVDDNNKYSEQNIKCKNCDFKDICI